MARLLRRIASLEKFPLRGRSVPEIPAGDLRELLEGHFRIVYRVSGEAVQVLTIFDSRLPFEREPGS